MDYLPVQQTTSGLRIFSVVFSEVRSPSEKSIIPYDKHSAPYDTDILILTQDDSLVSAAAFRACLPRRRKSCRFSSPLLCNSPFGVSRKREEVLCQGQGWERERKEISKDRRRRDRSWETEVLDLEKGLRGCAFGFLFMFFLWFSLFLVLSSITTGK